MDKSELQAWIDDNAFFNIGVIPVVPASLITGGSGLLAVNWAAARQHIEDIWLGLNNRHITMDNIKSISLKDGLEQAIAATNPDIVINI